MDCREVQGFLHAYLDGEFAEEDRVAIAAHLETCEECRAQARVGEALRLKLRESYAGERAPAGLKDRVLAALDEEARPESAPSRALRWIVPAAAAALLLVGVMVSRRPATRADAGLAEQSVLWHRQDLPLDVRGPSPDTVRAFFTDKVPFAVRPPVFDLPEAQLVGGRLTNLREYQAAFLVYQVGGRRVSVFVFDPGAIVEPGGSQPDEETVRVSPRAVRWHRLRGYNVALYRSGGTGYAVASDLEPSQLVRLISHSR